MNFEQWLQQGTPAATRFFSLARHALVEALRLAGVGRGDSVLLPEFICRDVLAALATLGAQPVWYRVSANLAPADPPDSWPVARAFLVVNYFGFPQALEPFRTYAARTGALLIEDNAHGFLSRDAAGAWLGLRGDAGLFSLRKTLPLADGAALVVGNVELTERLPPQLIAGGDGYAPAVRWKARLRRLPLLGVTAQVVVTALVRGLRRYHSGHAIAPSVPAAECVIPHPPVPHAGLMEALAQLNVEAEIARRRTCYIQAERAAHGCGIAPLFPRLPPLVAPYCFPFRAGPGAALECIRRWATRRGFDLISWPDLPGDFAATAPTHYRDVYLVNFLW